MNTNGYYDSGTLLLDPPSIGAGQGDSPSRTNPSDRNSRVAYALTLDNELFVTYDSVLGWRLSLNRDQAQLFMNLADAHLAAQRYFPLDSLEVVVVSRPG